MELRFKSARNQKPRKGSRVLIYIEIYNIKVQMYEVSYYDGKNYVDHDGVRFLNVTLWAYLPQYPEIGTR